MLFWQVLLLSARLSPTAVHHLLTQTKATAIIASPQLKLSTAQTALEQFSKIENVPVIYDQISITSCLEGQDDDAKSIYAPGCYIDEDDRNVLILHSSGTTGLPKAIYTSHGYLLSFTTCHALPGSPETERLCLSTLPLYHVSAGGSVFQFLLI